ncbi:hypothetical protein [Pseudanabaena sp. ABRG5-3]|uniref:hypothetical protein n=1 Tax=Pseudanabaena sp. ABRG5-3 TaxID=685565 RepID=UPI000DC6DF11|nr:hypothetical protein [Pseudanabaena sp. ABRG5-3]BBC24516.1 hypothetical protein ABRG53_2259 [Pseudanabaena sp. ABRG5-3]
MLALFLLSQVATLSAPTTAALTQHQQAVVFPKNQNSITFALTPMADARISKVSNSPKTAIAQCSPEEFNVFFEQFVRNPKADYIDSEFQIRDYQDPSMLLMTISDKNYVDFRIGAIGNRYVYYDPNIERYRGNDELLKERLKLDFQRIDAKTFRVNYIRAEFINDSKDRDGNLVRTYGNPEAYIFEHLDGCWHLTQSLRQYRSWKESKENKLFTRTLRISSRIELDNGEFVYVGKDNNTFYHDRIVTAYTDLFYYKKLDAQFGYAESDQRNRWREWNILREAVSQELTRFYSTLQCSSKKLVVVPRFDDYDDSSGTYGSQSLDRIAKAIAEYHALQSDPHLSPEAEKKRWLEIRKKISINTNDACSILGN